MRPKLEQETTRDIGPYRFAHRFAVGGMAEVYRALWPQSAGGDRAVVIKRLRAELNEDPEQRRMFEHELTLGQRIDHPNVVGVLDHGLDEGVPYLVLEYVFGVDLWRLCRGLTGRGERLPVPLAVWIATELLAGLEAVHAVTDAQGAPLHVVHRDVSPSNVFLSVHGEVKLGDLGIARAALRGPPGRGARAKGKLGYLSPEQVSGKEVDQRADVFSAAVVLAELLLGRPLFSGATEISVLLAIRDGDVSALRARIRKLPAGLGDVVLEGLERARERRIPTARELRERLLPFVEDPVADLQRELGQRVVSEMDETSASQRGALAQTIEKDAAWFERETPPAPPTPVPDAQETYDVARGTEPIGAFKLGELLGAIATGQVEPNDRVAPRSGGEIRSVSSIPHLARHLPISTRTPTVRRRTRMAETSELYDLTGRSMLSVLTDALVAREDGLLLCERGPIRKEVYLERGAPCFVSSNQPTELLGEQLVAKGALAREELDMALAVMPRFEGRLGETLVALGLVDAVDVFMHISDQVRDKLLELFTWTEGHVALYRNVERPDRGFPLAPDPWELLEEGAARRLEAGLDDLDRSKNTVLSRTDLELELPPRLAHLATACAAPRSIDELDRMAAEPARERARLLVLIEAGILRWRGVPETS